MSSYNIRRFFINLLFMIFFMYILAKGDQWGMYFKNVVSESFNPMPYLIFQTVFPMSMGVLLALPNFINKINKQGFWNIDWIALTSIGLPTLYGILTPILYFSPVGKIVFSMFVNSMILRFTCGIIFGYVLLSVFDKRIKTNMHTE